LLEQPWEQAKTKKPLAHGGLSSRSATVEAEPQKHSKDLDMIVVFLRAYT
jgi:hypothetical protein